MKEIQLTQGKIALVDDDVFDYLNQWKWYYNDGYAQRNYTDRSNNGYRRGMIKMHRVIMDACPGIEIDHINGNKADNRKENLRICNRIENMQNQRLRSDNRNGFKGVQWREREKTWYARITVYGKRMHLGSFDSPEEAARAYDEAAIKYYGEFARLNYPND